MPTIFDNIENVLKEGLNRTLEKSKRADFCIGYFNLRGWKQVTVQIDNLKGDDGNCCRLLIGMQKPPLEIIREYFYKTEEIPLWQKLRIYLNISDQEKSFLKREQKT